MTAADGGGEPRAFSWSSRLLERVQALGLAPAVDASASSATSAEVEEVSGLLVSPGSVSARVDGFDVWLDLRAFDSRQWLRAEQALAADDRSCERLIAGEVPESLDALLARAGLSLLPARGQDLTLECSCPQWAACRHLAAVLGAFAAAVEADPFLLLTWRGRERDRLLLHLRDLRAAPTASAVEADGPGPVRERPLSECLDDFWREGERHRRLRLAEPPDPPDAPRLAGGQGGVARLGPSAIMIRGHSLEALLQPAYDALID